MSKIVRKNHIQLLQINTVLINMIEWLIGLAIQKWKKYYNDVCERKRIIDELEGSFYGAPIDATNTEVPLVAVEVNYDEDI